MDTIDDRIMNELRLNARIPITELSKKIGRSRTAVQARIDKLEREGKITGYTIRETSAHAEDAVGFIVLVWLSVRKEVDDFMAVTREIPEVLSCHGVSGDPSFALIVRRVDNDRMLEIVEKVIEAKGVTKTETILSMFQAF